MKPKTQEFLYLMLWTCDLLARPTLRNLTGSFEEWAYRNGFARQLAELERAKLLEAKPSATDKRIFRLTEQARLHAIGGRDPEAQWGRFWDGNWRMVLFDVPLGRESTREQFRRYLRSRGFGCLQRSVWISPDPLRELGEISRIDNNVRSLVVFEGRACGGEADEDLVRAAWDFEHINSLYAKHLRIIEERPRGRLQNDAATNNFRRWTAVEREAFLEALTADPLLPEPLLPKDYLGRKSWMARVQEQGQVAEQLRSFRI